MITKPDCSKCEFKNSRTVVGWGSDNAELMIISDYPSYSDIAKGQICSDDAGRFLKLALSMSKIDLTKVYFTSVIKCKPAKITKKHIDYCLPTLNNEIKKLQNLKKIICLGRIPAKALFNFKAFKIRDLRLKPKIYKQKLVYFNYNPRDVLSNLEMRKVFINSIKNTTSPIHDIPHTKSSKLPEKQFKKIVIDAEYYVVEGEEPIIDIGILDTENPNIYYYTKAKNAKHILEDPNIIKIGYEIYSDKNALKKYADIDLKGPLIDVLPKVHLIDESRDTYTLKSVGWDWFGIPQHKIDFTKYKFEDWASYNSYDLECTKAIYDLPFYESKKLEKLFYYLSVPQMRLLNIIQNNGILIDIVKANKHIQQYTQDIDILLKNLKNTNEVKQASNLIGKEFNYRSNKHLKILLIDVMGLQANQLTPTGQVKITKSLLAKYEKNQIVKSLLKIKHAEKMRQAVKSYLDTVNPETKRIHSTIYVFGTVTGRLASAKPNILNPNEEIRDIFIPAENNVFIDADFSQIELRVLAWLSNDTLSIKKLNEGIDYHTMTAQRLTGKAQPTDEERKNAKKINFGLVYGMSIVGLAKSLGMNLEAAQNFLNLYFKNFPSYIKWKNSIIAFLEKNEFVENVFGRRRRFHRFKSLPQDSDLRKDAIKQAVNFMCQSTASDLAMLFTINLVRNLQ
ncbi:MAG: DNA polymerase, partial [Thermoplasmata archaeon]